MFAVSVVLIPVPMCREVVETEDDLHVDSVLWDDFDDNNVAILVEFEPGQQEVDVDAVEVSGEAAGIAMKSPGRRC